MREILKSPESCLWLSRETSTTSRRRRRCWWQPTWSPPSFSSLFPSPSPSSLPSSTPDVSQSTSWRFFCLLNFHFLCLSFTFLSNVFPAGVHPENEFSFWSSSFPCCYLFLPLHLCILSQQVQIQIQIQRVLEIQSLSYDYDMSTNTWSCPDNFVDSGGTTDDGYKVERKYQNVQPNENFCSLGVAHWNIYLCYRLKNDNLVGQ